MGMVSRDKEFYNKIETVINEYSINQNLIFSLDKIEVTENYCLPRTEKNKTITLLACGLFSLFFFVFARKRMLSGLLVGSITGMDGVVSEYDHSNAEIFK